MKDQELVDALTMKMFAFDAGDPMRIQHLMKVHRFAQMIARAEGLEDHTRFVLECAAVVHDIGIHPAEAKYGSSNGKLQEQEGPAAARSLLTELGLEARDIDRICYLVGHHHTYEGIEGMDYQILVEADFLVNFHEDGVSPEAIRHAEEKIFRTAAGKQLCDLLYGRVYQRPAAPRT